MEPPKPTTSNQNGLGKRATKLNMLFEKYVERIIQSISYAKFAICFSELDEQQHEALVMAHQQVCAYLESSIRDDFQNILSERQLIEKLNELDKLVEEAKRNSNAAELKRSAAGIVIEPEQALRARSIPLKLAEIERLRKQYSELQGQNQHLMKTIVNQRDQLTGLCNSVSQSLGQFEQAVETASGMSDSRDLT
ncbi:Nnf1-domain-containing protein [Umbelopsis sp. PMI_123]|nr:Nnf1-domain-containing protein [Umbelopsis sp. PMI_123]